MGKQSSVKTIHEFLADNTTLTEPHIDLAERVFGQDQARFKLDRRAPGVMSTSDARHI